MIRCKESEKYRDKKLLELLGLDQAGLIIKYPSGVVYQNQVRGVNVRPACEEGFFIPLSVYSGFFEDGKLQDQLSHFFVPTHALLLSQLEDIIPDLNAILEQWSEVGLMKVDQTLLDKSCEAWIHITIQEIDNKTPSFISGFIPCKAVLTWKNSD